MRSIKNVCDKGIDKIVNINIDVVDYNGSDMFNDGC